MTSPDFVLVTSVLDDAESAGILFKEVARTLGRDLYVVAVDDGSIERPLTPENLAEAGLNGVILRLSRNVGHQRAIATGLRYANDHVADARRIVVMDCDGEDRPETILQLLAQLEGADTDIVVAERRRRFASIRFRLFYAIYRWLFGLLTGRRISFGNFMAMKPEALKRLAAMGELPIHVAGTVLLSRLRWRPCPIDRGTRYAGTSRMNFVGLVLHGFKGLMVFAEDVLVRVGAACALVAAMSVLAITAAIILKSVGYATPGWFSVALGILFIMFLQTGAITLMTLLLTGVMRSAVVLPGDYRPLIERVIESGSTARRVDGA
ncbi:MAG TPA: glycosyltransferase [Xanthomonadaceae bacterium]|nr:glycosyltransferase [Xanthomonadaceae bacterium]